MDAMTIKYDIIQFKHGLAIIKKKQEQHVNGCQVSDQMELITFQIPG